MQALKRAGEKFEVAVEIFAFLWQQKLWWMIPMAFVILVVGMLLVLAQGSALSPFIYTLFCHEGPRRCPLPRSRYTQPEETVNHGIRRGLSDVVVDDGPDPLVAPTH